MMTAESFKTLLSIFNHAGVDEVISPLRQNSFHEIEGTLLLSPKVASETAEASASAAETLEDLKRALQVFEGCSLKYTATNLVFGDGNPQSRVMLIGEAPGAD